MSVFSSSFFDAVAALMRAQLREEPESGELIFDSLIMALAVHTAGCMSEQDRADLMLRAETEYPKAVAILLLSRKSESGLALDIEDSGTPA